MRALLTAVTFFSATAYAGLLLISPFRAVNWTPINLNPTSYYEAYNLNKTGSSVNSWVDMGSAGFTAAMTGLPNVTYAGALLSGVVNGNNAVSFINNGSNQEAALFNGKNQMVNQSQPFMWSGIMNFEDWHASAGGGSYWEFFSFSNGASGYGLHMSALDQTAFPGNPELLLYTPDSVTHGVGLNSFGPGLYTNYTSVTISYNGSGWGNPSNFQFWVNSTPQTVVIAPISTDGSLNNSSNYFTVIGAPSGNVNSWVVMIMRNYAALTSGEATNLHAYYKRKYNVGN